ncbi:MFS transporter [Pseudolysinimonas yzui]|uniref:MFS transporter n=1 Tax=Pseudolysinimonas yzui TaxID=2708254 RepID=A0A8J3E0X6_9MICO|nr:MFS transporter [Pseudolysinimonas yzui]GHF04758.1 MFS transporter [Pseudolysinimonas yzui]
MATPARDLRRGTVVRYAVGSVGTGGFGTLPGLVLLIYMTNTLGVSPAFAGAAFTISKIWDVIIDPWIGARSDRSLARTGARRRFMVLGAILLPVFFVLTFAVPPGLPPLLSAAWVLVAFLLAATAFSLFQVPYIALPAELVDSYDARTRLLSARVIVLTLAILAFGGGAPEIIALVVDNGGTEYLGYLAMAAVAGLVFLVAFLIASTVERSARVDRTPTAPGSDPIEGIAAPKTGMFMHFRRGWSAVRDSQPYRALLFTFVLQALAIGLMLAGVAYVAADVLHLEGTLFLFLSLIAPAMLVTPLWSVISRRIGKERAFRLATVLFGLAALSLVLLVWFPGLWLYGPVALAGAAYAGLQSLPLAMLPDTVAYDAETHGPGRAGTFSGVWTAGETAGLAFGGTILSIVLAVTGFIPTVADQTVTQPASAIVGIILGFSVIPALLMFVSLISLARYPLRKADIDRLVRHADAPPPSAAPVA